VDPREASYVRSTAEDLSLVAEQTQGADLLLLTTTRAFSPEPEKVVAAAKALHPLGNLVITGHFLRLAGYARALSRAGFASYDVVLPLVAVPSPPLGRKVVPGHLPALVAFRDPGHIERPRELPGGTLLLSGPDLPPEADDVPVLLLKAGLVPHLELENRSLAALIERYSEPGGLVVAAGVEAPRAALLALLLGRRALAVLEAPEQVPAYKMAVRLLQDLSSLEREPERKEADSRALRTKRR
jgi:hypothetical protein